MEERIVELQDEIGSLGLMIEDLQQEINNLESERNALNIKNQRLKRAMVGLWADYDCQPYQLGSKEIEELECASYAVWYDKDDKDDKDEGEVFVRIVPKRKGTLYKLDEKAALLIEDSDAWRGGAIGVTLSEELQNEVGVFKELQSWLDESKSHSVQIYRDDGFGCSPWTVELHTKDNGAGEPAIIVSELIDGEWRGPIETVRFALEKFSLRR